MNETNWKRIEQLLEDALARPEHERAAFLAAACADATDLRAEVESLLDAHARTDGPLDRLAVALGPFGEQRSWDLIGRCVGPYTLVRELGRGGMGVVYLAWRGDGEYDRLVALKVIESRLHDERQRNRFLTERQILARMTHPGIAQLFDGGITDEGLPYFTMEYVDGLSIDRHCDEHGLDVAGRLRLFSSACEAVAAAHRSLVVHRDLKPSNILVTREGAVKLLDFGIAKLLDDDAVADLTRTGMPLFTPEYASPEQVRGETITTASDVYSLGAVLYYLLTGVGAQRFTSRSPAEIERTICEREPPLPSSVATVPRTARQLAGDIDTIVMKALHKDPARRYASVELLRQDIDHHLRGFPVMARPDSWPYRTRKFAARHRTAAIATALVTISVVGGLAGTLIEAERARQQRTVAAAERDRARAEAERVRRVSALLTGLFKLADPEQAQGRSITAREMLDRAARRIDSELAGDPKTQADLLDAVGQVYRNLALYEPAEGLLQRSLALRRKIHRPDDLELAESLQNLGVLQAERSAYADAEVSFREAVRIRRARGASATELAASLEGLANTVSETAHYDEAEMLLREALRLRGSANADTTTTLDALGLTLHRKGDYAQAERLFRDAVEQGRRLPAAPTPARVSSALNLARLIHRFDRDPRAAEPLYREALDLARRVYPLDHPDVATCLSELARGVRDLGNLPEAEAIAREGLAMWRRLYGDRHREVMISAQTLAGFLAERGNVKEADGLFREALATGRSLFGENHPLVLGSKAAVAGFLEGRGRWDEALTLRESELAGAVAQFGEHHANVARAVAGLGRHRSARGQLAEAERLFRRALAIRERIHPAGHWRIAEARVGLGRCLLRRRAFGEAEELLRTGHDGLRASKEAPSADVQSALTSLIELYEASHRTDEAARYRALSSQPDRKPAAERAALRPSPARDR